MRIHQTKASSAAVESKGRKALVVCHKGPLILIDTRWEFRPLTVSSRKKGVKICGKWRGTRHPSSEGKSVLIAREGNVVGGKVQEEDNPYDIGGKSRDETCTLTKKRTLK